MEMDWGKTKAAGNSPLKMKSVNRLRYEAEVEFLRRQNGDLEAIRARLGISRRKMCQTLLVDPSAWSRWTAPGQQAPAHVYRALDWYLSLMEKDPEYRRLAVRFAEWLNHEKDHEGRLASLEAWLRQSENQASVSAPSRSWWALGFALMAGVLLTLTFLKLI